MGEGVVEAGLDNGEPRTPENTTPTSFHQWCEEVLRERLEYWTSIGRPEVGKR